MTERIKILTEKTIKGEMWQEPTKTEYDDKNLFLKPIEMSAKRVCEYIVNQEFLIPEEACFTGLMKFDGSVEGDIFNRPGHKNFDVAYNAFYNKPVDNLLTFEWQHSVGDFEKIIKKGLSGIKEDIEKSKKAHAEDVSAVDFLNTQTQFCDAVIKRAEKASEAAEKKAQKTQNNQYRENLIKLSEALKKVPEYPAESFYEAVLCLYFVYPFIPDSIGLIDRYLFPYYNSDVSNGTLTVMRAKEYLQELYLMLQARIHKTSNRFYRGGESHFCIGGYLEDGSDGFNAFSKLIVEALMELPTWIPQISLRWTKKTPKDVLKFMMDCNEIALPGGMVFGFDPLNVLRSVENTFYKRCDDIIASKTFDEFFNIYKEELFSDLDEANRIGKGFQDIRSRDCNIVSNIFLEGCIENAKSCIQGGLTRYIAVGLPIGLSNVIDSLAITKQFVYDEKKITMKELTHALSANWEGYEALCDEILQRGNFFGNDDECSNEMAQLLMGCFNEWNNTENYLSKKWLFGNLIGYNEHHKFFGDRTKATPDGRYAGDVINFGIGQTDQKDRNGITALLNSVAKCDPYDVLTGPSVTNILIDENQIQNDEKFEKLVSVFEAYFENGGTHFQLTYVSN